MGVRVGVAGRPGLPVSARRVSRDVGRRPVTGAVPERRPAVCSRGNGRSGDDMCLPAARQGVRWPHATAPVRPWHRPPASTPP